MLAKALLIKDDLISWRRHFHQYPEGALHEFKTAEYIIGVLKDLDLPFERIGPTGVVAFLEGKEEKNVLALRADMDALPIREETGLSFSSKNEGYMHACGHDAHMAMLLGAAKILKENFAPLKNGVKFIFQPSEETPPGGAKDLVEAGVLKNPDVKAIFGLHVSPQFKKGSIALKKGVMMANCDIMRIMLKGRGGHGSNPQENIDPLLPASYLINALYSLNRRILSPFEPAVISLGEFKAGSFPNITPETANLAGTVRTLEAETRVKIKENIAKILEGLKQTFDVDYSWQFELNCPPVVNDEKLVNFLQKTALKVLKQDEIIEMFQPSLISEDFAYYTQEVPGCFFYLGTGKESFVLHSPRFNLNEDILPVGSAILAQIACDF